MTTEIKKAEEQALTVPEQARGFIVTSNEQYAKGEEFMATCKTLETDIHNTFDPICDKAFQAHKEAVAQRKKYLDPLEEGRKILKQKMIAYQNECERIRREEQRRLEAEARKRAEEDALALAAEAEAEGDSEAAEAIIAAPLDVAPVMAQKVAPAPSRLTAGRSVWSAELVNMQALVKAVAEGKQPITLLLPNQVALNKLASALKQSMNVPGVKAVEKRV